MGKLIVEGWLYWIGWIATAAMALSIVGMAISVATGQSSPGAGDNGSVVVTNFASNFNEVVTRDTTVPRPSFVYLECRLILR